MIHSFLSELIKLRRKAMYLLLGVMSLLSAIATGFAVLAADTQRASGEGGSSLTKAELSLSSGLGKSVSQLGQILGVVALCAGASIVAMEYSNGTWRNLLVRQPRRIPLLAGKILAIAAYVFTGAVLAILTATICSFAFASVSGIVTSEWLSSSGLLSFFGASVNVSLSMVGFAAFGVVLAVVLRSPVTAVGAGLAYSLVFENLVSVAANDFGKWLPGQMLTGVSQGGSKDFSYPVLLVLTTSYVVCFLVTALTLFHRTELST
jgi:ABC-2 type transport system permease protein